MSLLEKKVLEVLKTGKIINQNQYNNFNSIIITQNYFSSYMQGTSAGGAGGGGFGGGGIGGGGGGGR